MNIRYKYPLITLFVSLMASGCVATQDDVGGLYSRQSRLEAKVDRLTKQVASTKSTNVGSETPVVIDHSEQIFQLENKVFELEQSLADLNDKVQNLSYAPPAPAPKPLRTQPAPPPVVSTPKPEIVPPPLPEKSKYDLAYSALARGDYSSARSNFKSYIKNNADGEKVPEAIFLIADSYYREGLYEEAILEYQTLIDRYPKNSRVPLSYLKQGLSLIKINRVEEAKLFLESLIDKYPGSQEADEAREKLSELNT